MESLPSSTWSYTLRWYLLIFTYPKRPPCRLLLQAPNPIPRSKSQFSGLRCFILSWTYSLALQPILSLRSLPAYSISPGWLDAYPKQHYTTSQHPTPHTHELCSHGNALANGLPCPTETAKASACLSMWRKNVDVISARGSEKGLRR